MSDDGIDESYSGEDLDTDTGSYSLDDEDQLQPEDTLVDRGVKDALDEGYSPADRAHGSQAWGVTAWEQSQDETIEQRIKQEIPDPDSAYGAPDNESGLDRLDEDRVGGDDPDSIPAEDDFVGDGAVRSGRLVAPDEGVRGDDEKDSVGTDVGFSGGAASAEEAAMHVEGDRVESGLDNDGSDELGDAESAMHAGDSPDELADLDGITDVEDDDLV